MSNNISLNEVKNGAFLAKQSYETFNTSVDGVKDKIINPTTNSSFEVVAQVNDEATGFSGTVFKDPVSGEYTIAFRGTEKGDLKDLAAGFSDMLIDLNNRQFKSAMEFANKQIAEILAKDPDAKISLTEHSLGGALA